MFPPGQGNAFPNWCQYEVRRGTRKVWNDTGLAERLKQESGARRMPASDNKRVAPQTFCELSRIARKRRGPK